MELDNKIIITKQVFPCKQHNILTWQFSMSQNIPMGTLADLCLCLNRGRVALVLSLLTILSSRTTPPISISSEDSSSETSAKATST